MYFVYILASDNRESLYIGVTSDLPRRLAEHQQGIVIASPDGIILIGWSILNPPERSTTPSRGKSS
jgi:predicted GIY-YIG superfamily endonuclease